MGVAAGPAGAECPLCGLRAASACEVQIHRLIVHAGEAGGRRRGGPPVRCLVCGREFAEEGSLIKHHARVHMGRYPFECGVCRQLFEALAELRAHVAHRHPPKKAATSAAAASEGTTTSATPPVAVAPAAPARFGCATCHKKFVETAPLQEHVRTHSDDQGRLDCRACRRVFVTAKGLRAHACRAQHRDAGDAAGQAQPWACPFAGCGRRFESRRLQREHSVPTHGSGPRPTATETTSRTSSSAAPAYRKLLACQACGARCATPALMRAHLARAHIHHRHLDRDEPGGMHPRHDDDEEVKVEVKEDDDEEEGGKKEDEEKGEKMEVKEEDDKEEGEKEDEEKGEKMEVKEEDDKEEGEKKEKDKEEEKMEVKEDDDDSSWESVSSGSAAVNDIPNTDPLALAAYLSSSAGWATGNGTGSAAGNGTGTGPLLAADPSALLDASSSSSSWSWSSSGGAAAADAVLETTASYGVHPLTGTSGAWGASGNGHHHDHLDDVPGENPPGGHHLHRHLGLEGAGWNSSSPHGSAVVGAAAASSSSSSWTSCSSSCSTSSSTLTAPASGSAEGGDAAPQGMSEAGDSEGTPSKTGKEVSPVVVEVKGKKRKRPVQQLRCEACGKRFVTASRLQAHRRTHIREDREDRDDREVHHDASHSGDAGDFAPISPGVWECDVCKTRFNRVANLERHKDAVNCHVGLVAPSLWQCDVCGKRFNRMSNLDLHKRTVSCVGVEDDPASIPPVAPGVWQCDVCGKRFNRVANLERHKRSNLVHVAPDAPRPPRPPVAPGPWKCDVCGLQFSRADNVARHKRSVHSDARPFRCGECGCRFTFGRYLTTHITRVHKRALLQEEVDAVAGK